MKSLILFLAMASACMAQNSLFGNWNMIQAKYWDAHSSGTGGGTCAINTTTCVVNTSTVAAGDVIIAYANAMGPATATTLSSISGETTVDCTSCDVADTGAHNYTGVRYVLVATGGETSFTCTISQAAAFLSCGIIELHWPGASVSFDTGGNSTNASCTSCAGPALTLCGGTCASLPDAIVSIFNPTNFSTGATWARGLNNCCAAFAINNYTGTNTTWTQAAAAEAVLSSIAIQGASTTRWAIVQSAFWDKNGHGTGGGACAVSTTTCIVNVSTITPGHVLVAYGFATAAAGSNGFSSISGETWTHCAACLGSGGSGGTITSDVDYVLNSAGGEGNFTCTFTQANNNYQGCGIIELAAFGVAPTFDVGNFIFVNPCPGTNCIAPSLSALTGTNDVLLQFVFPVGLANTIDTGYTAICNGGTGPQSCSGQGSAYLLNSTNGTAPNWTFNTSGQGYAGSAIAIK